MLQSSSMAEVCLLSRHLTAGSRCLFRKLSTLGRKPMLFKQLVPAIQDTGKRDASHGGNVGRGTVRMLIAPLFFQQMTLGS